MDENLDTFCESVFEQIIPFVSERTGIERTTIEQIIAVIADFWEAHPNLMQKFHEEIHEARPDDSDDDGFCSACGESLD